ncbi:hypothetical protein AGMMS50256_05650 [Betaproteobacteria bacterium]|nr:hypothetical protein AGMMS50256_05650 [Betaproteobacteria bacterium]
MLYHDKYIHAMALPFTTETQRHGEIQSMVFLYAFVVNAVQNRKYRCVSGREAAASQTSS